MLQHLRDRGIVGPNVAINEPIRMAQGRHLKMTSTVNEKKQKVKASKAAVFNRIYRLAPALCKSLKATSKS